MMSMSLNLLLWQSIRHTPAFHFSISEGLSVYMALHTNTDVDAQYLSSPMDFKRNTQIAEFTAGLALLSPS